MGEHSKSPWRIVYKDGETHIYTADDESIMCDMTHYPWVPENMNDWFVMAAGPQLLTSLEVLVNAVENGGVWTIEDQQKAHNAIAKARDKLT